MKNIVITSVFAVLLIIIIVWATIKSMQLMSWIWAIVITIGGITLGYTLDYIHHWIIAMAKSKIKAILAFLMILIGIISIVLAIVLFILYRNTMGPVLLSFFGGYCLGKTIDELRKGIKKQKQSAS